MQANWKADFEFFKFQGNFHSANQVLDQTAIQKYAHMRVWVEY